MEYEILLRIFITLVESIATGAAIYWICSPYIQKYEKGKKFMVSFLMLDFIHRVFRAWYYLHVPQRVQIAEYLIYYVGMLAIFVLFLKGNPVKHLIYLFGAAFLFDLYGTISMVGLLLFLEGFDMERVSLLMVLGDEKSLVIFLLICVSGAYFIRILVEAMGHVRAKWMDAVKIVLAIIGAYSRSKVEASLVFFGVPVFIVMLLLNVYYQSRSYQRVKRDYETAESKDRDYDVKANELNAIRQEALSYLENGEEASEYEKEIIGRFDTALKGEEVFEEKAERESYET